MSTRMASPSGTRLTLLAQCAIAALLPSGAALAAVIDTGNPDVEVVFDNTIRYNLGIRAEGQDPRIANAAGNDLSDNKFGRRDIVTNRLDLLSELDVKYKNQSGLRLSGAAWYDHAYNDTSVTPGRNPTTGALNVSEFTGNQYNSRVKRFYRGPSGELLDAFVFTAFDAGSVPVSVKLGKHVVYWGEGLLLGAHAISYSQAPSDGRKALASPGIETKEVFMPINQISGTAQLTSDVSLSAQYFLDWKPTRAPAGGTYLSASDAADVDFVGGSPQLPYRDNIKPKKKTNSYGAFLRWKVPAINSSLGFYYRQFDDYNPHTLETAPLALGGGGARFIHANDVKLYGVSLGTTVAGASVGLELSYRKGGALNTAGVNVATHEGARGDTFHIVANAVQSLPNSALWTTGTVVAELAASSLDKVTSENARYKGVGQAGCTLPAGVAAGTDPKRYGCSTTTNFVFSTAITPQYLQVASGLDLSVPVRMSYGIKGNGASAGSSGNEGEYSYSVGLVATYQFKHEFSLTYADRYQRTIYNAAGNLAISGNGSQYALNDRGALTFTYKTAF